MIRRLALLLAMAVSTPCLALDSSARAPIEALDTGLVEAMRAGARPFAERYAMLAPLVERAFDLDAILQSSVGPKWANFTPAQQQQLRAEFSRFTIASYVANFSSFSGERFEIGPDSRTIGADQVVETRIIMAKGDPARIDYVMRQDPGGWRAIDVLLDGSISRAAVQRSDFRSLVDTGPEPLVESLHNKAMALSGGVSLP